MLLFKNTDTSERVNSTLNENYIHNKVSNKMRLFSVYYMLQPYRLSLFVSVFSFRYGPALMAHSELFVTSAPPVEGRAVELDVLSFLDQFGEDNSTAERCYRSHSHSSVLQGLPFGGVPTVLAINGVLWMVQTHTQSFSLTFYKKNICNTAYNDNTSWIF